MAINANLLLAGDFDQTPAINLLAQGIKQARNRKAVNIEKAARAEQAKNTIDRARFESVAQAAHESMPFLERGDIDGLKQNLTLRKDLLTKAGIMTEDTDIGLDLLNQDPTGELFKNRAESVLAAQQAMMSGNKKELQRILGPTTVIKDGKEVVGVPVVNGREIEFLEIGEVPNRIQQKIAEAQGKADIKLDTAKKLTEVKAEEKGRIVTSEGAAERAQNTINAGLDAAKGIPTLKRSIALLGTVKTGGFQNALLRAKQAFGVEGADEGELSANLGEAILGDLKTTFGAQFTEREGERLERIRANFGKSPDTNRRLLQQSLQIAQDAAERAIKEASNNKDFRAAQEIQDALDFEFKFDDLQPEVTSQPASVGRFQIEVIN